MSDWTILFVNSQSGIPWQPTRNGTLRHRVSCHFLVAKMLELDINHIQTGRGGGGVWRHPRLKSFITHERLRLQRYYFVIFPQICLETNWCRELGFGPVLIFGPFVFSFQFLVLVSLEYWQNGLYKLSNEVIQQICSKKIWQRFDKVRKSKMAAMKIQDVALVTSCDVTAEVW